MAISVSPVTRTQQLLRRRWYGFPLGQSNLVWPDHLVKTRIVNRPMPEWYTNVLSQRRFG